MHFKQNETIPSLSGKPQKLIDQFICQGSNVSSTESDGKICLEKVWTAIVRFSILRKSDLSDKIKRDFVEVLAVSILIHMDAPQRR